VATSSSSSTRSTPCGCGSRGRCHRRCVDPEAHVGARRTPDDRCPPSTNTASTSKRTRARAPFQPVKVEQPSVAMTIDILKGLREVYEEFHAVKITDQLSLRRRTSLTATSRTVLARQGIDLIDEAESSAHPSHGHPTGPAQVRRRHHEGSRRQGERDGERRLEQAKASRSKSETSSPSAKHSTSRSRPPAVSCSTSSTRTRSRVSRSGPAFRSTA